MSAVHTTQLKVSSPLELAVRSFYLDREAKRSSARTLAWYRQYITALRDWLNAQDITDPAQVTANHIRAYFVDVQGRGLAATTIHHHASAARAFFNFCADEGLIAVSPMLKIRMPHLPKEILPAFSEDDVRALLQACDTDRDRAITLCLLDTGCRLAEFVALTIGSVDVTSGTVAIRQGKGRKDRVTFLGTQAKRALRKYLATRTGAKPKDPLWAVLGGNTALTRYGLQHLLDRLGERAGVENCHAHTFRRTFALWSLRAGMNIYALQQIMGHASLEVLKRYLALTEDDLEQAHRRYGAVDSVLGGKKC